MIAPRAAADSAKKKKNVSDKMCLNMFLALINIFLIKDLKYQDIPLS